MGSKNAKNAKAAKDGAADQPVVDVPKEDEPVVKPCDVKHWFGVRVEFDDGKLVETGIKVRVTLNNGETRDLVLNPGTQPGGKYDTTKILDLTTACDVTFPDMYDAEVTPK